MEYQIYTVKWLIVQNNYQYSDYKRLDFVEYKFKCSTKSKVKVMYNLQRVISYLYVHCLNYCDSWLKTSGQDALAINVYGINCSLYWSYMVILLYFNFDLTCGPAFVFYCIDNCLFKAY